MSRVRGHAELRGSTCRERPAGLQGFLPELPQNREAGIAWATCPCLEATMTDDELRNHFSRIDQKFNQIDQRFDGMQA